MGGNRVGVRFARLGHSLTSVLRPARPAAQVHSAASTNHLLKRIARRALRASRVFQEAASVQPVVRDTSQRSGRETVSSVDRELHPTRRDIHKSARSPRKATTNHCLAKLRRSLVVKGNCRRKKGRRSAVCVVLDSPRMTPRVPPTATCVLVEASARHGARANVRSALPDFFHLLARAHARLAHAAAVPTWKVSTVLAHSRRRDSIRILLPEQKTHRALSARIRMKKAPSAAKNALQERCKIRRCNSPMHRVHYARLDRSAQRRLRALVTRAVEVTSTIFQGRRIRSLALRVHTSTAPDPHRYRSVFHVPMENLLPFQVYPCASTALLVSTSTAPMIATRHSVSPAPLGLFPRVKEIHVVNPVPLEPRQVKMLSRRRVAARAFPVKEDFTLPETVPRCAFLARLVSPVCWVQLPA